MTTHPGCGRTCTGPLSWLSGEHSWASPPHHTGRASVARVSLPRLCHWLVFFRCQLPSGGQTSLSFFPGDGVMVNLLKPGPPCRFGSFEIFKAEDEHTGRAGPSVGRNDIRVQMLDYVVSTFYPEIQATHVSDSVQRNAAFFREVGPRGARSACPGPWGPRDGGPGG